VMLRVDEASFMAESAWTGGLEAMEKAVMGVLSSGCEKTRKGRVRQGYYCSVSRPLMVRASFLETLRGFDQ
jgi:hypothetical protein